VFLNTAGGGGGGGLSSIESSTLDVSIADGVATVDLPYEGIPLAGTETGAPITGDLQVKDLDGEEWRLKYIDNNEEEQGLGFQFVDDLTNVYQSALYSNTSDGSQSMIGISSSPIMQYIAPSAAYFNTVSLGQEGYQVILRNSDMFSVSDNGTTRSLGFFGQGSVQAAAIADATDATDVITQLNTLLAAMRAYGLIAE
jgi:hypothetical protein